METESSSPKTGGLKLVTVFIIVLALHVVVIGGISAYHFLKGTGSDVASTLKPASTDAAAESKDATVTDTNSTATPSDATAASTPAPTPAPEEGLTTEGQAPAVSTPPQPATTAVTPAPVPAPAQAAPTPAPTPVAQSGVEKVPATTTEYVAQKGDTLSKISHHFGMKVADLKKLNGLTKDEVKIGQKFKVTLKSDAAVAAASSVPAAPVATSAPAPAKAVVSGGDQVYTVAKGDTLTKIAKQFKTTASALMAANKLTNAGKLSIGEKLHIPSAHHNEISQQKQEAKPLAPKPAEVSDLVMAR